MTEKPSNIDLIAYALKLAPESADHAEDVLEFFCEGVERMATDTAYPDPRILNYLATCSRRILDGVEPKEALNLDMRAEGQRRRRTYEKLDERDIDIALSVARRMRHGQSREDAFYAAAEQFGVKRGTVRNAHDKYGKNIKRLGWNK
jgi:hypothetical protein